MWEVTGSMGGGRGEMKRAARERVTALIGAAADGGAIRVRRHVGRALERRCPVTRGDGLVVDAEVTPCGSSRSDVLWHVQTEAERAAEAAVNRARLDELVAAAKQRRAAGSRTEVDPEVDPGGDADGRAERTGD